MALSIEEIAFKAHANAKAKGFWDDEERLLAMGEHEREVTQWSAAVRIALIHSEASEALEELRMRDPRVQYNEGDKPCGFASELADIIIRVCDLAEWLGIDIAKAVLAKLLYNRSREAMHGKRF